MGLTALLKADARHVTRDAILGWILLMAPVTALILDALLPWFEGRFPDVFQRLSLTRFLVGVWIALSAQYLSWVGGFLLLEEREHGLLAVVDVTPLGRTRFMAYRLGVPTLLGVLLAVISIAILAPRELTLAATGVLLLVALQVPLFTLLLTSLARDRVDGLVWGKLMGQTGWGSVAILLLPVPWLFVGGIFPPFWTTYAWMLGPGTAASNAVVAGGVLQHLVLIALLGWIYRRRWG